jgi:uncharacterized FlaG/YvyC family protein
MNERSVHPISNVRTPETATYSKIALSEREETGMIRENPPADVNRSTHKPELGTDFTKNLANISIHFNVDDETNRLVVVVTERKSGRVIRTIPASELEKMQAGDLLRLAA